MHADCRNKRLESVFSTDPRGLDEGSPVPRFVMEVEVENGSEIAHPCSRDPKPNDHQGVPEILAFNLILTMYHILHVATAFCTRKVVVVDMAEVGAHPPFQIWLLQVASPIGANQVHCVVAIELVMQVLDTEVRPIVSDHGDHLHHQGRHCVHQSEYEVASALGFVWVLKEHLSLAVPVCGVQVEAHRGAEGSSLEGAKAGENEGAKGEAAKGKEPMVRFFGAVASCIASVDSILVEPGVKPALPEEQHDEEGEEGIDAGEEDIGGRSRHLLPLLKEPFAHLDHFGGDEDDWYAEEEAGQEEVGAGLQVLHPKDSVVELPGTSPHHHIAWANHQLDQEEVEEQTNL